MELLAVKLSLLNTGGNYPIRCRGQRGLLRPLGRKIKGHAGYEKRNRKMDQDNMLRMFCQDRRLEVKGIHVFSEMRNCPL